MTNASMVSVDFYDRLNSSLKNSIKFDKRDKLKFYDNILNNEILLSARLNLMNANWIEARNKFKSLIRKGNFSIKLQSVIGMICAVCRRDLESLAILSCRPKLRDASGEWDTTLFDKNKNLSMLFKIQIYTLNFSRRLRHKPILRAKF
jgi:hypothetical protein